MMTMASGRSRKTSTLLKAVGPVNDVVSPWFIFGDDPRNAVSVQLDVQTGAPQVTIEGRNGTDDSAEVIQLVTLLAPTIASVPKMEQLRVRVVNAKGTAFRVLTDRARLAFDPDEAEAEQAMRDLAARAATACDFLSTSDPLDLTGEDEAPF